MCWVRTHYARQLDLGMVRYGGANQILHLLGLLDIIILQLLLTVTVKMSIVLILK
jgi:hypothetical protein